MTKFFNRKRMIIFAVGVLVVITLILVRDKNGFTKVEIYSVTNQEVLRSISASGKTAAKSEFVVYSSVTGTLDKLNFESGEEVFEDSEVLVFNKTSLRASAESAWASYLSAKSSYESLDARVDAAQKALEDAEYKLKRAQNEYLGNDSSANRQVLNTAEATYESAVSSLTSLLESDSSLKQQVSSTYSAYLSSYESLENAVVHSPSRGFLALEPAVKAGALVSAGQKLFSVTNSIGIEFIAEIEETDVEFVKPGQNVTVLLDGYSNREFEGTITRVDAKTSLSENATSVVEAAINLDISDVYPIVGMSGTAEIHVDKEVGLAIPVEAVLIEDDIYFVYILKEGMAARSEVDVEIEGDDYYLINSGIMEGDVIITGDEVLNISDGEKVSPNKSS